MSSLTDWHNAQVEIIEVKSPSSRRLLETKLPKLPVSENFIGYKWALDNQHWVIADQFYNRPLQVFNIYSGVLKPLTADYVIKHFMPSPIH